jgi:hypothetical protein
MHVYAASYHLVPVHVMLYCDCLSCHKVTPEKRKRLFNYYTYTGHTDNTVATTTAAPTANERNIADDNEVTVVSQPFNTIHVTVK